MLLYRFNRGAMCAGMMACAVWAGAATTAHAAYSTTERSPVTDSLYLSQRIQFRPPDRGAPPATTGAGSRGPLSDRSIEVLIPTAAPEEDRFSLTTDENPVLWVYVYPSDDPTTELSLRLYGTDPQTQEPLFVRQTFEMPTEAGLMAMPLLPDGDEPLLLDTPYEWALFIQSEDDLASIPLSSGWVERTAVADDLMTQIETAEGLDAIALYAEAGLWHNTIDELIELRQTSDDPAITQAWNDVLSDAGLEAIAIDSILPCCLPTPTPESDP